MLYANKFFKTEKAAAAFQQKHGGAMYCGLPGSKIAEDYRVEACMAELSEAERTARPYCVAWNVVDEKAPFSRTRCRRCDLEQKDYKPGR